MDSAPLKESIRDQFDRSAHHYDENSLMADHALLDLIVRLADPKPGDRALDVACGAGFLVRRLAGKVREAVGIDLSGTMLAAAEKSASALGLANTRFQQADVEALPFADETYDIVTCKLALHYFPDPARALSEMKRVARRGARLVLIDRVASEEKGRQQYHNRIELLRTPSKTRVYSCSEIVTLLEKAGHIVDEVHRFEQHQDLSEWMRSTGASAESRQRARELVLGSLEGDLAGLKARVEGDRILITHSTAIIVATKAVVGRVGGGRGGDGGG